MDVTFIKPHTRDWDNLWELLGRVASDKFGASDLEDRCPCCGEAWQYMGTYDGRHEFRHRHHPKTHQRENLQFRWDHDFSQQVAHLRKLHAAYYGQDFGDFGGVLDCVGNVSSDADSGL